MINKNKIIKISIISLLIFSFSSNVFAIEKNNDILNETNLSESLNKKLYDAIENNNLLLVKELISKGVKVNQNRTIFEKFEELADLNYNTNEFKNITPLMIKYRYVNTGTLKND